MTTKDGTGAAILQVDLNLPDHQIERVVAEHCSALGRVISVKVHRSPSVFALIEMAKREQTYKLVSKFGGSTFGTSALIHLEQRPG